MIYSWLEESPEKEEPHTCRPVKKLKFDEADNEKLQKLKEKQNSPDPEPVSPGEVENRRIMNIAKSLTPRSGRRYLANKVIKIETVSPEKEKRTSTPKKEGKRSKDKLKEANKRTKEVLARLETNLDKPENKKLKVINIPRIVIPTNNSLFIGRGKVKKTSLSSYTRTPKSPGGKKIYINTHLFSFPNSSTPIPYYHVLFQAPVLHCYGPLQVFIYYFILCLQQ